VSYKVQIVTDADLKWIDNGLRFATEREALAYGEALYNVWLGCRNYRVVTSEDPALDRFSDGQRSVIG